MVENIALRRNKEYASQYRLFWTKKKMRIVLYKI